MAIQLKFILESFVKEKQKGALEKYAIERELATFLAPEVIQHTALVGVYKNKLMFIADSSIAKYQLTLQKQEILHIAQRVTPQIDGLIITIGGLPKEEENK